MDNNLVVVAQLFVCGLSAMWIIYTVEVFALSRLRK